MRAERDPDRLSAASRYADPEVIDVGRDAVDFRGEGDRLPCDPDEITVSKTKPGVPIRLSPALVWQSQASVGDGVPSGRSVLSGLVAAARFFRRQKQIAPKTATVNAMRW